jgi:hypothetical protein
MSEKTVEVLSNILKKVLTPEEIHSIVQEIEGLQREKNFWKKEADVWKNELIALDRNVNILQYQVSLYRNDNAALREELKKGKN